ncbi:glycosyltransferase [Bisgaard Taxon 10/6]|uniref:glycosyltransferase n=1 Tax=Exercitatus varius TaxID=67857 RepID=UPI00294B8BA8|nr:glycosyltransferase [Exercitatus varius]MDG2939879.1 glycosyltransferase [Exercitatus varius]
MKHILVYGMTDNFGGMEAYIYNVYQHLDRTQIQFDFVCDFPQMTLSDYYLENGCKIHFIPPKSQSLLKSLWSMWKVIKENNYDVIYFNIMNAGYVLNMIPAFLLGKKIVAHSHNADTDKKFLHYRLRGFLNFIAKMKLACTKAAADFMFGKIENCILIKNGIDLDKYQYSFGMYKSIRNRLGWNLDSKFVLYVARMDNQKNPFFALNIAKKINQLDPSVHFIYVGDGPMRNEVFNYIAENNVNNIHLLGIRHDVNELMIASDALILPSLFEGLGIVAIEAQAAALPVFLSDTIPLDAKILDTTEFLPIEKSENVDLWASKVVNTVNNNMPRKSDKVILAKAGYDIKAVAKQLQSILLN